jgi:hypothetical protein
MGHLREIISVLMVSVSASSDDARSIVMVRFDQSTFDEFDEGTLIDKEDTERKEKVWNDRADLAGHSGSLLLFAMPKKLCKQ